VFTDDTNGFIANAPGGLINHAFESGVIIAIIDQS